MTIFREYGPFKGVHNSSSNLLAKNGYLLDSYNLIGNQDNGDLQKRPGVSQKETISECYGVSRFITSQINDAEKLFIVGSHCRTKNDIAASSSLVPDVCGPDGIFPVRDSKDFFSSTMYNGNLYFNYGDSIYKWDGLNAQVAGMKGLRFNQTGDNAPEDYLMRVYGCDNNQKVSAILEQEVLQLGNNSVGDIWNVGLPNAISSQFNGPDLFNRSMHTVSGSFDMTTATDPFTLSWAAPGSNTLVAGDVVFLPYKPEGYDYRSGPRYFDTFKVLSVDNVGRTVTFSNPSARKVSLVNHPWTASGKNAIIVSPFVIEFYKKSSGVYTLVKDTSLRGAQYCIDYSGIYDIPTLMNGFLTRVYEYPEFRRRILPRCKHLSSLNGLFFMSCPKVVEGLSTDDTDFDYQSIAWSSENPEDPPETWGGMSAIIGTEDEGRVYATIPNNGNLVIFKERAIHIATPPMDGLLEVNKIIGSSVGCKHPESIQECNGVLFFYVEGKGVYMYRAGMSAAQEATSGFRGLFKSLTGVATSSHDIFNSRYVLNVNGTIFVYDYLQDSWWIWGGFNGNKGLEYFNQKIVGVTSANKLFAMDGVLKDNLGSDVAISSYFLSNWYAGFDLETDKKLKAFRIWALNGSHALTVEVFKNFRYTADQTFTIQDSQGVIDVGDFSRSESGKRKFKAIAFKVSNATISKDMKITGWAIDYEPTGIEPKNSEGAR